MKQLYLLFLILFFFVSCQKNETVKFAVCADVHQDIIHDAPERIINFIKEARKENVDFIIQLGDFCFPIEENKSFINNWNLFEGHKYHVLGNHDIDVSSKIVTQKFWGMEKPFYSFDLGNFHFIVLDPNYFFDDGKFVDYENGNWYVHDVGSWEYIPPQQIEWLKGDLEATEKLTVVFSHQSLEKQSNIKNQEEVRKVLEEANLEYKKVIACFNGHTHDDVHNEINGIHYIRINSLSYKWVGRKYEYAGRFDNEINKNRPSLKYTIPYDNAIFAIVEIDSKGYLTIKGSQSTFVPPGPEELGMPEDDWQPPLISHRQLDF